MILPGLVTNLCNELRTLIIVIEWGGMGEVVIGAKGWEM